MINVSGFYDFYHFLWLSRKTNNNFRVFKQKSLFVVMNVVFSRFNRLMGQYSIKDLEEFSGIKAHTLRIWEQRYNLLEPSRTDTNIRLYDDVQLKLLLNAAILYKNGYKISKIAAAKKKNLSAEVNKLFQEKANGDMLIDALVVTMVNMDELSFEELINKSIAELGFDETIINVIFPFFEKIGVLWLTDVINPGQEHFVSNLIRQKLICAIDNLGIIRNPAAKKCVAFLHEEELHEIGLLFYTYQLRKHGVKVIYLGQVVPYEDARNTILQQQPDWILTGFVKPVESDWLNNYIHQLLQDIPSGVVLSSGFQSSLITVKDERLFLLSGYEDLLKATTSNQ
jgi:MerR family transcriptional regulator, light-induced transcriptional regulator